MLICAPEKVAYAKKRFASILDEIQSTAAEVEQEYSHPAKNSEQYRNKDGYIGSAHQDKPEVYKKHNFNYKKFPRIPCKFGAGCRFEAQG